MHWLAEIRQLLHFLTGIICYLEKKFISLQKNSVMKFSKIYTEWVTYLKKNKLYGAYILDYARVNEYITSRERYRCRIFDYNCATNHKFLNSRDLLIENKSDENMTFTDLAGGIERFQWNMFFLSKHNWRVILEDFSAEFGYYKRPEKYPFDEDDLWSEYDVFPSSTVARTTNVGRRRDREEANIGQWYDIYYQNNRGRRERVNNSFINNVRWRR
jgi:hypothetical protein